MASDDSIFDKSIPKEEASELNPPDEDDSNSGAREVEVL